MNLKNIALISLLLVSSSFAFAQGPEELVRKASQDYSRGNYTAAIESYQKVIDQGWGSAALYYNTGNAYFKASNLPSAILFYEKARKLSPNDEAVIFNLKVANSKITDKIEAIPALFYIRWWRAFCDLFPVDTWARTSIVMFVAFFLLLSVYLFSATLWLRKLTFWSAAACLAFTLLTMAFASHNSASIRSQKEAVIFDPSVTVKSSPDEKSIDLFVIHEGTKVSVMDNIGDWYEVRIANGSVGWVRASVFKTI